MTIKIEQLVNVKTDQGKRFVTDWADKCVPGNHNRLGGGFICWERNAVWDRWWYPSGYQNPLALRAAQWSEYQSIAYRQWRMESLSIPETNPVWRPRMKEFFYCLNLFYNNCCSERSLSKSRFPIAVSGWIWRLECFRSHSHHRSQHPPKTISSISAKALVLIFWDQRK